MILVKETLQSNISVDIDIKPLIDLEIIKNSNMLLLLKNDIAWQKSYKNQNFNIRTAMNYSKIQHPHSYIPTIRQFTPLPTTGSVF